MDSRGVRERITSPVPCDGPTRRRPSPTSTGSCATPTLARTRLPKGDEAEDVEVFLEPEEYVLLRALLKADAVDPVAHAALPGTLCNRPARDWLAAQTLGSHGVVRRVRPLGSPAYTP